jgi:hypothetical protein
MHHQAYHVVYGRKTLTEEEMGQNHDWKIYKGLDGQRAVGTFSTLREAKKRARSLTKENDAVATVIWEKEVHEDFYPQVKDVMWNENVVHGWQFWTDLEGYR